MGGIRRFTWLLFGFLLALALVSKQAQPEPVFAQANHQLPEVVAPVGEFLTVYETARPATLRIEARVDSVFFNDPYGVGTGFFISPEGLVLTAYHVVDSSEVSDRYRRDLTYIAVAPDETEYALTLVGFDASLDLAVLKAETTAEVPYLTLAQDMPRVGSDIVAIGNSRDDFLQARAGRVTKIGVDSPQARFADDTIQLTAALAPGDSGGPVINSKGEVVGVVSYIALNQDQDIPPYLRAFIGENPGFASYAAPVTLNNEVISALKQGIRRDVPVIGFSAGVLDRGVPSNYDPADGRFPNLGKRPGVIVGAVVPEGPANQAGLHDLEFIEDSFIADVIVAVDGESTPSFFDLIEALYLKGVGQTVTITVQRGKQTFKLRLELGAKRDVFN
jgi:S1-C subfamily serine protease